MSAPVGLTTVKGGIQRQRVKGAALKDSLYDLVNAYVTSAKTVKVRPGTFRRATLNPLTKGLCSFRGTLHVFCHETVAVPVGYENHVLTHPAGVMGDGTPIPLLEIHFAEPMMGYLYVVAEFEPGFDHGLGDVFHYWLQTGEAWTANTAYKLGAIVAPTTPNGLAYQATRIAAANPSWAPNILRAEGDVVEPTTYNDFFYTVVETEGANPVSGATEPAWPTENGAQVIEDSESAYDGLVTPTEAPDPDAAPAPAIVDRYKRPVK